MMPALDYLQSNAAHFSQLSPGFFYWSSGVLSSVLDNAPTYLSFLKAMTGAFVDADVVQQVQALIASQGGNAEAATEAARNTYAVLTHQYGALLHSKPLDPEQIRVAYLIGNTKYNNYLVAVSIAAVFFGANTYIGNGPNFMVKSIADHQKVHTPGFLGYILWFTLPVMVPMLLLVWWLFFT
jgi:Na+/H+ antiporter NhaD/arsenite permease-like protein